MCFFLTRTNVACVFQVFSTYFLANNADKTDESIKIDSTTTETQKTVKTEPVDVDVEMSVSSNSSDKTQPSNAPPSKRKKKE